MPTLTSLTVNLKGDSSSLTKATRTSMRAIRGLSRGIAGTVVKIGALGGAVAGLAGGAGLLALGKASAKNVDAIGKLSTQLGVTGTDVQKMGLIADMSGISSEGLVKAMQRVTRIVGDAGAGSKEARKLLDRLGLSFEKLQKMTSIQRFAAVVGALNGISSATEKASVGNKLFEEQWQRLNPLLESFEVNMGRAIAVFDVMKFGIGDGAKAVENLNDNMGVFSIMAVSFRDLVYSKVAPGIDDMVVKLGQLTEGWIKASGGAGVLADKLISEVGKGADWAMSKLGLLKDAASGIAWVFDQIVSSLRALGTLGAGVFAIGEQLTEGNFSGAGAIASGLAGDVASAYMGTSDGDDATQRELEKQTQLLRDIAFVENGGLIF